MNNPNNIDNYFKEHLENLEAETAQNRWRKLYWMLIYKKVLIWVLVLGIAGVIFTLIFNPSQDKTSMDLSNDPISLSTEDITSNETSTSLQNENESISTINQSNSDKSNEIITESTNTENQSKETVKINPNIQKQNPKSIYQKDEKPESPKGNIKSLSLLENLTAIQFMNFETVEYNYYNIPTRRTWGDSIFDENGENKNSPKVKTSVWSASLFLNPAYNTISLSGDDTYNDHIIKRNKSEENIFTLGAAAEARLSMGNFFMQSGIDYSVYGQDANYKFATDEIDYENSYFNYDTTWVWVYDPPFAYPYPLRVDSTFVPEYKMETTSAKNRYTYLEIPFIVGVQLTNDKKVSFEMGTGLSFGFLLSAHGQLPSPENNSLTEISKSSLFLRNTSINFIVQSGVRFKLSDKTNFVVRPYYKGSLQSIFEKGFPIDQKFRTLGISIGMTIKL